VEIIETPVFAAERDSFFSDEEYRKLQNQLIVWPNAGAVIPRSGGLRKLRWATRGRGKRGGARVIYYRMTEDRLYLLFAYHKGEQEDLTHDQIKRLRSLLD